MFKRGKHWNSWSPGISFPWDHKKGLHSCCSRGSGRCNLLTLSTLSCTIKSRKPVLSITLNVWLKLIQLQWVGLNKNSPLNICHSVQFRKTVSLFFISFVIWECKHVHLSAFKVYETTISYFTVMQFHVLTIFSSTWFLFCCTEMTFHVCECKKGHCKLTRVKIWQSSI